MKTGNEKECQIHNIPHLIRLLVDDNKINCEYF